MFLILRGLLSKLTGNAYAWLALVILILAGYAAYKAGHWCYQKGYEAGHAPVAQLEATIKKMGDAARDQNIKGITEVARVMKEADTQVAQAQAAAASARETYLKKREERAKSTPASVTQLTCNDGQVLTIPTPPPQPFLSPEGMENINTLIDQAAKWNNP